MAILALLLAAPVPCAALVAKVATKGFASTRAPKPLKIKQKPWKVAHDEGFQLALDNVEKGDLSIENYLNPELLDDPAFLDDARRRLQHGEVVVLRNAFRPEFAEVTHRELMAASAPWSLNEAYFDDGYAYQHHNIYNRQQWTAWMNRTFDIFDSKATKRWAQELTGRDCSGLCTGSPSYYKAGDHSLPHTDWAGQRTVAYVWHLSKDWRPEWGGALYWAQNPHIAATFPASFNTLVLFGVTTFSAHFVTTVSPHAKAKRLAYNGWWQSAWQPRADDAVEEMLATAEKRRGVTHAQLQALTDMVNDPWQNIPPERRESLAALKAQIMDEFYPSA
mmetsp:Transcript_30459/g.50448  ORF Transcript_30459/g.50448 Transcript_30459/m.50448 type:complete len:334 (+) Transcript_30459:102-1103(+)|eukprot:CAMPEP_0119312664 /NCGR_PEP_ID=MMETSP1333-20130426/26941_1 /TAXON_ID=418940 /ORGANISM="Scyphosphaera apsteinii, Strain RCC1455" /LENGTH=333 /DNA_ID=CAMNT_0007317317 /DNA_START=97 /DNA_END=1098 /DNA_ORIENTATION=-